MQAPLSCSRAAERHPTSPSLPAGLPGSVHLPLPPVVTILGLPFLRTGMPGNPQQSLVCLLPCPALVGKTRAFRLCPGVWCPHVAAGREGKKSRRFSAASGEGRRRVGGPSWLSHLERWQSDGFQHVEAEGDPQSVLEDPGPPGGEDPPHVADPFCPVEALRPNPTPHRLSLLAHAGAEQASLSLCVGCKSLVAPESLRFCLLHSLCCANRRSRAAEMEGGWLSPKACWEGAGGP